MALSRFLLLFAFLSFWPPSPVSGQRAKPGDFPWRFRLVVSNDSEVFYGTLKFDIYFDPKSNRHQTLLIGERTYQPGSAHSSLQKMSEGGMADSLARIEATIISDSGNCSTETLSLKEVSLTSFHKRRAFLKRFDDDDLLVLSPRCDNSSKAANASSSIVAIGDFKAVQTNDCYYQGDFYEADQSFDIGCSMKCRCKDGMVDCDSMCKPLSAPLPRNCRMASVDRRCCDEAECMEDAVWDSCPVHTAARDKMPPWAVILAIAGGKNESEGKRTCGASIIHRKLLITSASCVGSASRSTDPLDSSSSILVTPSVSNATVISRAISVHIHPAYNGKDASADLALIELGQEGLEFSENLRRVNLPWPTLCKRYMVPGCAVQYTTVDSFDSYIGTVVSTSKFCPSASSISAAQPQPSVKAHPGNGTEPVFCVQRMTDGLTSTSSAENVSISDRCNQENGNGVVTKRAQYHYIIGVAAHEYKPKSISQSPKTEAVLDQHPESRPQSISSRTKRGDQTVNVAHQRKGAKDEDGSDENWRSCGREYIPVTNLCPHIDWLKNTINSVLARE